MSLNKSFVSNIHQMHKYSSVYKEIIKDCVFERGPEIAIQKPGSY